MNQVDIAIVGGGPAGMAAAITLAVQGADFVMIDSYPQLGGHYFKQSPHKMVTPKKKDSRQLEYQDLMRQLESYKVNVLSDTSVWSIFPTEDDPAGYMLYVHGPHQIEAIQARYLLLTSGAYDRPLVFPGWQLPGVMTLGGAQMLIKGHGVRPGQRALVAGSGPLLLAAAASLIEAETEVVAMLDLASIWEGAWKAPQAFWGHTSRIKDAWHYGTTLKKHGVPILWGHTIFRAIGEDEVRSVAYGQVDSQWRPRLNTAKSVAVDTVCVALGFLPNLALTRHLGCEHHYDPDLDAFYPRHDQMMTTSLPDVYVAGDVTGLGGKDMSKLQGQVAALSILQKLPEIEPDDVTLWTQDLTKQIKREKRFIALLRERMRLRSGLNTLIEPDTLVCRCEMVQAQHITTAVEEGARDLKGIKLRTRCGMGACQGRYCEPQVRQLVAAAVKTRPDQVGYMTVRPPLIPLQIGDLLCKYSDEC